jgi:hypothetical protein
VFIGPFAEICGPKRWRVVQFRKRTIDYRRRFFRKSRHHPAAVAWTSGGRVNAPSWIHNTGELKVGERAENKYGD